MVQQFVTNLQQAQVTESMAKVSSMTVRHIDTHVFCNAAISSCVTWVVAISEGTSDVGSGWVVLRDI